MKKLYILFLISAIALRLPAQEAVAKIDSLMAAWVNTGKFNGTALVAQKGHILLLKGYGYKNAATHELNDGNTIFQAGSITKQFTAALILHLQQQKKLSVKDKLSKYFPQLAFADKVSLENLLSHTSGIYNYTNDSSFMKTEAVKPASQEKIFSLFKDKPLEFEPGTQFNYSNSNYILLGYTIEKITGKPYEQVMHEMIFKPLQLDHTGFNFAGLRSADKAIGYFALTAAASTPAPAVDSSVSFAAGALYTTVNDLYKWGRSLYTEKIISRTSLKDAYTLRKGLYGLGWVIDSAFGKELYQHSGGTFGFSSFIVRSPSEDACVVLLDNKADGGLENLAVSINAILHNQPYDIPKDKIAVAVDTTVLQQYVGNYELSPNFIISVTREKNHLMLQASGQQKAEMYAEKENFFF